MSIKTEILRADPESGGVDTALVLITVAVVISLLAAAWIFTRPLPSPPGTWKPATETAGLQKLPKVDITPPKVKVYSPKAKKQVNLPPALQQDDNKYVLASSTLSHSFRPQTVTTVIDRETGESTTITRQDPYPGFAFQQTGEARVDYLLKNGGARVGRFTLREDLVQIKGANLGATITLDTDRTGAVGFGIGYRW